MTDNASLKFWARTGNDILDDFVHFGRDLDLLVQLGEPFLHGLNHRLFV